MQIVEESVQTEAVSKFVKQENHQNIEIFKIWTNSYWYQCFHSFTQYYSCSVYWQYADLREKSQESEMSQEQDQEAACNEESELYIKNSWNSCDASNQQFH